MEINIDHLLDGSPDHMVEEPQRELHLRRIREAVVLGLGFEEDLRRIISRSDIFDYLKNSISDIGCYLDDNADRVLSPSVSTDHFETLHQVESFLDKRYARHLRQMAFLNVYILEDIVEMQRIEYRCYNLNPDSFSPKARMMERCCGDGTVQIFASLKEMPKMNKLVYNAMSEIASLKENVYHFVNSYFGLDVPDRNGNAKEIEKRIREISPQLSDHLHSFHDDEDFREVKRLRNEFHHKVPSFEAVISRFMAPDREDYYCRMNGMPVFDTMMSKYRRILEYARDAVAQSFQIGKSLE